MKENKNSRYTKIIYDYVPGISEKRTRILKKGR